MNVRVVKSVICYSNTMTSLTFITRETTYSNQFQKTRKIIKLSVTVTRGVSVHNPI
jgi:hypothetical protein